VDAGFPCPVKYYTPGHATAYATVAEACPCTEYSGSGTETVRFYTNTG